MKSKTIQEFKETEIGNIPADWKIKKINDLYEIRSGLSKPRDQFGFGYPFLSFKGIFENFSLPDKLENLVNSSEKERESGSIKRGDVFLTRTSETWEQLGMSSVALKDYENATFNGFAKRLRPINNEFILPEFAAYLFRSPKIQTQFSTYSNLTTRASLNGEAIKQVLLTIPTRKEQEKISKSLSDLTIKISNLQNQNRILEEMAQAIFQSWFVDFDGVTEFEDSELGKIPKGWSVGKIKDVIEIFDEKRIPLSTMERVKRKGIIPYYGATTIIDFVDDHIFDGKFLLLGEDGSVVHDDGTPFIQYVSGKFWVNNHAHVMQGKNSCSTEFVYLFFKNLNINPWITGAVQLKVNQSNLLSIPIIIANPNFLKKFNQTIFPIFSNLLENEKSISILTKTRDALLPKLLSGEIRV